MFKWLSLFSFLKKNANQLSFLEHLEALRGMIVRSIGVIMLLTVVAFFFRDFIFDTLLLAPREDGFITNRLMCRLAEAWQMPALCLKTGGFTLQNLEVAGQFRAHLYISFIAGIIAAFPYILAEIWLFIKPALYKRESKYLGFSLFSGSLLFFAGVLFGYFIITPLALNFLINYTVSDSITNQIQLSNYIRTIGGISLSCGLVFQLPLLVFILSKFGILTSGFLKKYRKHSYVLVFIIAAIITPPDVFSQILVAIPLIFLYEISIFIAARNNKN